MERLDKLLVSKGYFSSREKAKEAIKRGLVLINGKVITKPSTKVDVNAEVKILEEEKPRGYWKLRDLDKEWQIIKRGDVILDLGSSAGGFLLYASERASFVYGVEYSEKFREALEKIESERDNIKVFIADAFKLDIRKIDRDIDVILTDLTLKPKISFKAVKRFLPLLKKNGKILFIAKVGLDKEVPNFENEGLKVIAYKKSSSKKEEYYLLVKAN